MVESNGKHALKRVREQAHMAKKGIGKLPRVLVHSESHADVRLSKCPGVRN